MLFQMNMFEPNLPLAANRSVGYESVLRHRHAFVELVYVENGKGIQKLDTGQKMTVKKGDVFIIADDTQHSIRPACEEMEFRIINILFAKEAINIDYDLLTPIQIKSFPSTHPIVKYIYNYLNAYESKSGEYVLCMRGWLYLILTEYLNYNSLGKQNGKKKWYADDYVSQATKFIHENYNKKLTLKMIADHVGLSSGYLQKLFHKCCKTSIIEYLLRYRMEKACKMLVETESSVQHISEAIGFSDIKNFHYSFKKIFGDTPMQFRSKHKKEEGFDE